MSLSPVLKPDQDEAAETSVQQQHESTWNVEEPSFLLTIDFYRRVFRDLETVE